MFCGMLNMDDVVSSNITRKHNLNRVLSIQLFDKNGPKRLAPNLNEVCDLWASVNFFILASYTRSASPMPAHEKTLRRRATTLGCFSPLLNLANQVRHVIESCPKLLLDSTQYQFRTRCSPSPPAWMYYTRTLRTAKVNPNLFDFMNSNTGDTFWPFCSWFQVTYLFGDGGCWTYGVEHCIASSSFLKHWGVLWISVWEDGVGKSM